MRNTLIEQLRSKGIHSEDVLNAIASIPRHFFFESAFTEQAYKDIAFPIGEGQTISQPYTVAFQTQLLEVKKNDKVLEIGTGSGYQTCILLKLGAIVYTIEYNKILFEKTKKFLPVLGYHPKFFFGDGTKGLPTFMPYDKIIVTAGGPFVPETLKNQLKIKGVLVIPVGDENNQKMLRITRMSETEFNIEEHGFFSFVKLLGDQGWK